VRGLGRICNTIKFFDYYEAYALYQKSKGIAKHIVYNQCDIIDATSNRGVGYGLSKIKRRPPIFTRISTTMKQTFDSLSTKPKLNYRILSNFEIRQILNSNHLVTHTKLHAKELSILYKVSDSKFKIIPHAINFDKNVFITKSNNSLSTRILFIGRLEKRKGYDILFKSIPIVLSKISHVTFDFCGKITEEAKSKIKFLKKWKNSVNFYGYQERSILDKFLNQADIFVAPSCYESFGIVYLEAMKFAKPIVACDSGGTREVVSNNVNGLLVEPNNHQQLADALILLCKNKQLREFLGQNGRNKLENSFSIDNLVYATLQNYKNS
jgi:glycosyltransferase involved in cell wall biosynthesis